MLHDLFKSIMRRCDLESREWLAVVVFPGGSCCQSAILGKSSKSWGVIAKNSADSGSAPSHCLSCSYILKACFVSSEPREAWSQAYKPPPFLPALFHLTHCTQSSPRTPHTIPLTKTHTHHTLHTTEHTQSCTHSTPHTSHTHPTHTHLSHIEDLREMTPRWAAVCEIGGLLATAAKQGSRVALRDL